MSSQIISFTHWLDTAAGQQLRAFFLATGDVAQHRAHLRLVHQRTHHRLGQQGVGRLVLGYQRQRFFEKGVFDAPVHQQPGGRVAALG